MTDASKPPEAAPAPAPRPELDDAPPLLGSWRNIYLFVLGTLALLIALFWGLTRAYS
ncbi:hypothetical protein ATI61_102337 [Archangium gephyra]|uniref:Uncharacterized protein n=1 Tax=Archangium gephyra TaxID=48 RepID=A0AAC8QDF4_9BACT|nr:hypothetical protein [Archangium gephyra]AKJ05274.1 Hypothetical protein AA314_06900 [Archangium gephyra]REG35963.1 hypothetical protein ATI61_102337 [Archangium gephyra]